MKATTSSGFLPLVLALLALFSALGSAWPQVHHRHGVFHRDHKNRFGKDDDGVSDSVFPSTTSVIEVLTSTVSVLVTPTAATPLAITNTVVNATGINNLCDADTGLAATTTSTPVLELRLNKRQAAHSTSTTVVYVTNFQTVTVNEDAAGSSVVLSSTTSSTITPSGSSNLASPASSTSSLVNPFDGDYASFVLGPVGSSASSAAAASSTSISTVANPFAGSYQSFVMSRRPTTTTDVASSSSTTNSTASTAIPAVCPSGNGTLFNSTSGQLYKIICDADFTHDDILPYLLVTSFQDCVRQCDNYNVQNPTGQKCMGAIFAPSRVTYSDDCYLKFTIGFTGIPDIALYGAILVSNSTSISTTTQTSNSYGLGSFPLTSTSGTSLASSADAVVSPVVAPPASKSSSSSTAQAVSKSTGIPPRSLIPSLPVLTSLSSSLPGTSYSSSLSSAAPSLTLPGSVSQVSAQPVKYASGSTVIAVKVSTTTFHGPITNVPSKQYLKYTAPLPITLASSLYSAGVNLDLTTNYDISLDTGILQVNASTENLLAPVTTSPHLSRDGGKGGYLNGEHLFIFCDTGSYTPASSLASGAFLGFVSSSCATDTGMNGLSGKALNIQDGIGEWSDDVGRMRGFSPLTQGEVSYNIKMQGGGQRYAVWPESSLIPLDGTHAILVAPIVYDDVDMATQAAVFTYIGSTLLTITAGGEGGPWAERTSKLLFTDTEVQWGGIGGIRSWGTSGVGGSDGRVYLFGDTANGLLLARTTPGFVSVRDSYEYWVDGGWSDSMIPPTATSFFLAGNYMDVDMFYSPRHLTFIIVYMTGYADNTFYFRYLNATSAILPPYAGGDPTVDFVENIVKYGWSQEQTLYKAPAPKNGKYVYAGGVHQGYFGADDITNGGSKILLSWTSPTGENPASLDSEYQIITCEVDLL